MRIHLLGITVLFFVGCAHPALERVPAEEAAAGEAAVAVAEQPTPPAAACAPAFPYAEGWRGGDAAYSVPLPDRPGTSLWLFGDSFVGRQDLPDRFETAFIHNTIALSRCDAAAGWEIEYFWSKEKKRAFFDRVDDGSGRYWWLFDGFVHAGDLYVGLLVVSDNKKTMFDFHGMQMARVTNHEDVPENWEFDVLTLSDRPSALPGATMVVWDGHVYFFTFSDGQRPLTLSRLGLGRLETASGDLSADLEFLDPDGHWKAGLAPESAAAVIPDRPSEMSVHYDEDREKWIAIYSLPTISRDPSEKHAGSRVFIRTADALEGPWSPRGVLFLIPEMDPGYAGGFDPDVFCYAAKAHTQLSGHDRLLLTYVCNIGPGGDDIWALWRNMAVYRPQAVSIPLPYWLKLGKPGGDPR